MFLVEHLLTNSAAFYGEEKFNKGVQFIADLPFLPFLEIFGIFLPLAFHAIYGIKIARSGHRNAAQYPYMANKRYSAQRITGYLAFVFIVIHLLKFRFAHWIGLTDKHFLHSGNYFQTTYDGLMNFTPWGMHIPAAVVFAFYLIFLACTCFHFANGVWTFCISWGITIGAKAQQRVGYAAAVIGIGLFSLGAMSLYGFATKEIKEGAKQMNAATEHAAAAPGAPGPSHH